MAVIGFLPFPHSAQGRLCNVISLSTISRLNSIAPFVSSKISRMSESSFILGLSFSMAPLLNKASAASSQRCRQSPAAKSAIANKGSHASAARSLSHCGIFGRALRSSSL